jgi:hypothetical protein
MTVVLEAVSLYSLNLNIMTQKKVDCLPSHLWHILFCWKHSVLLTYFIRSPLMILCYSNLQSKQLWINKIMGFSSVWERTESVSARKILAVWSSYKLKDWNGHIETLIYQNCGNRNFMTLLLYRNSVAYGSRLCCISQGPSISVIIIKHERKEIQHFNPYYKFSKNSILMY